MSKKTKKTFVERAYTTRRGRFLLNFMFYTRALKIAELFVRSPLSRGMIKRFIKKNGIDMAPYAGNKFKSFASFFERRKETSFDGRKNILISPCDGCLSVYKTEKDSLFTVKGVPYKTVDLITKGEYAERFNGGYCLVFRLRETDYHRFCFIDDGFQNENVYVKGKLHSVQPIALQSEPVYRVNRKKWTTFDTAHFGFVGFCAVGAVLVGGIAFDKENERVKKGEEMGRFELRGSTLVLFFEKDKIDLYPEILEKTKDEREVEVRFGCAVGEAK